TVTAALIRMTLGLDVRALLPSIQAPTLVLHREHNRNWLVEHGRYLGEHISGARYVELPGSANIWWVKTPIASSTRSRSSSQGREERRQRTGCSRRFCSRTSSRLRKRRPSLVTGSGASFSTHTTPQCNGGSSVIEV